MKATLKIIGILLIALNCVAAVINLHYLTEQSRIHQSNEAKTTLNITVLDGITNKELPGTKIVFPQCNCAYLSDAHGVLSNVSIHMQRDSRYDGILTKATGTLTILAYKDGYYDYALFDVEVKPDDSREIKIFMFPNDGSMNVPFTLIEGPDKAWTARLLAKYKTLEP